jgi:hypothetical protein
MASNACLKNRYFSPEKLFLYFSFFDLIIDGIDSLVLLD